MVIRTFKSSRQFLAYLCYTKDRQSREDGLVIKFVGDSDKGIEGKGGLEGVFSDNSGMCVNTPPREIILTSKSLPSFL